MFEAIRYAFRRTPKSDEGNALAFAYLRTQAPPVVPLCGAGRIVQRNMVSLEGGYILLGYGNVQNAVVGSSLGVNATPGLQPLTRQDSGFILGG